MSVDVTSDKEEAMEEYEGMHNFDHLDTHDLAVMPCTDGSGSTCNC